MQKNDSNQSINPQFRHDFPILQFPGNDVITLLTLLAGGIFVSGRVGVGKSVFVLRTLIQIFAKLGFGIILLCQKPEDKADYKRWLCECGREEDILELSPESVHTFDIFSYENRHPVGGGDVENLVQIPLGLLESLERGRGSGKGDQFWETNNRRHLMAPIAPLQIAGEDVNLSSIEEMLQTAPVGSQVHDIPFQQSSRCIKTFDKALEHPCSSSQRRELQRSGRILLREWPAMAPNTRSGILAGIAGITDQFLRGTAYSLHASSSMTVIPELAREGACIVYDVNSKKYGEAVGRLCGVSFLSALQRAFERQGDGRRTARRPIVIFVDELQVLYTAALNRMQNTMRSSDVFFCTASQNLNGLWDSMSGSESGKISVANYLSNVSTHIAMSNPDPETNSFYAELIGKELKYRNNFGGSSSEQGERITAGASEQMDFNVQPEEFSRLDVGEAICWSQGRTWQATGKPFIKVKFPAPGD